MFASMRRYRLKAESVAEFTRRVDDSFADQIAAQPGFVSYELIDCGDGDLFSLSIFLEPAQAEASRRIARDWTETRLQDIDHTRFDAVHGESLISRGALETIHVDSARKSVSIRLYRLGTGTVGELLQRTDGLFADRMRSQEGFVASHLLDCGDGEVLWLSVLRDDDAVEEADRRAARFMREELADFRPQHVVSIRGDIAVSRASAKLLEPAHA
jgi:putative component of toxin-antitoxin plasmid stabilization module